MDKDLCCEICQKYSHDMWVIKRVNLFFGKVAIASLFAFFFLAILVNSGLAEGLHWLAPVVATIMVMSGLMVLFPVTFRFNVMLGKAYIKNILHATLYTDDISTMRYGEYYATDKFSLNRIKNVSSFFTIAGIVEQPSVVYKIQYRFQFEYMPDSEWAEEEITEEVYKKIYQPASSGAIFIFREDEKKGLKSVGLTDTK